MHNSGEIFELGQSMRFPWATVNSIEDVVDNKQLNSRDFFKTAAHPQAKKEFKVPGPVVRFNTLHDCTWQRAPFTGEHNDVLGQLVKDALKSPSTKVQARHDPGPPLAGVRVLDFTWMLAGPYATRMLADFGAEVIKVQSRKVATGAEQNDTSYFATWNRNKLGITLDLSRPEARGLVLDLVKKCDVVIENFTPRVMDNWGLNYEKLKQVNPGLVMVSLSGFGHSGPWRDFAALGPTEQALSGLTQLTSYSRGKPDGIGFAYADHVSGLYAALAVTSALYRRDVIGQGAYLDISEYEAACSLLGPAIIDYALNGNAARPTGNRPSGQPAAPHGCYPCAGEDRWCAIAVFSENEWRALCELVGNPNWSREERFGNLQRRCDNSEELDALIAGWTAGYEPQKLMDILQTAGVPAAIVSKADDLARDPHLAERGFFTDLIHPILGRLRSDGSPIRLSATPAGCRKAAPMLGEDNRRVFVDLLGMDVGQFESYVNDGIIG